MKPSIAGGSMQNQNEAGSERVELDLSSGALVVDQEMFEAFLRTAVAYLHQSKHEHETEFVTELEQGQPVINWQHQWQRGAWRLEERDGCPTLVRHPAVSSVMHFFMICFEAIETSWRVREMTVRKLWGIV
jgi:hypothetical protein